MLLAVIDAVRKVAQQEIMPRYLKVAHQRKVDGSVFTEADIVAQTTIDFAAFIGLETPADTPHLAAWRERVGARPSASA